MSKLHDGEKKINLYYKKHPVRSIGYMVFENPSNKSWYKKRQGIEQFFGYVLLIRFYVLYWYEVRIVQVQN